MLGIRLSAADEQRLAKFARETGRAKSVLAREWIVDRLDREAIDSLIRNAAALDAGTRSSDMKQAQDDATDAWLNALDAEDGGYDWRPPGPPL